MKRLTALVLLLASTIAWAIPSTAQRENRSIGENGQEARKAAKQQRKTVRRNARKQRKALKKAQRKSAHQQRRRGK